MHRHSKSLCWGLGLLQSLRWTWHRHRKASRGELLPGLGTWIRWQSHWPRPFRPRWAFVCGWCGRKPWSFVGWHRLNCRSLGQLSFQPPGMMPTLQCNHIPEGSLAEACWIKPASCMELFPRSHRSHRSHCIIVTTWAETAFVYLLWAWKIDHHGSPFGPLVTFTITHSAIAPSIKRNARPNPTMRPPKVVGSNLDSHMQRLKKARYTCPELTEWVPRISAMATKGRAVEGDNPNQQMSYYLLPCTLDGGQVSL